MAHQHQRSKIRRRTVEDDDEQSPGTPLRAINVVVGGEEEEEVTRRRRRKYYRAQPTFSTLKRLGGMMLGIRHGYIQIDYDLVEYLAGNGLTQTEIAEALGVSPATVSDRLHGNGTGSENRGWDQEFRDAYMRGKAQMRHIISNGLFEKARKGDSSSLFFLAKTRMGWRENEPEKAQTNPADVAALLREELAKASA